MIEAELHRHLDGSVRAATLAELSQKLSTEPQFRNADDVKKRFWYQEPIADLVTFLKRFDFFQRILVHLEIVERLAYEATLDAHLEGLKIVEFRYSPAFASGYSRIPWQDVLEAFYRGAQCASIEVGIKFGFIGIITREYAQDLDKVVDFFIQNRKFFCGVDLAGDEAAVPARNFKDAFARARSAGLRVTIHAGEAAGPESIWDAIDILGAERIGHGVTAKQDAKLIKRLATDQILIECCPWSNFITHAIPREPDHPLRTFLDAGIPCSLSTDDPGIFGNTMQTEISFVKKHLNLSDADLREMNRTSLKHSFVSS